MDLGRKNKSPESVSAPTPAGDKEPKITYPQFDIRDEAADEFTGEYNCDVGDELTATVKLRVSGQRKDEYGSSITLEVMNIDNVEISGEEPGDAEEPDEEEKVLGYKRPQKNAAPPDVSAAEEKE